MRGALQVLRLRLLRLDLRLGEDIVMDIAALVRLEVVFFQTKEEDTRAAYTMLLEIATHNVAKEGALCLRQRLRLRLAY